jgi:hypothetical protein
VNSSRSLKTILTLLSVAAAWLTYLDRPNARNLVRAILASGRWR